MSQVEIRTVKSAAERKAFIHFPWQLYRSRQRKATRYPQWVPPLLVDEKFTFDKMMKNYFSNSYQSLVSFLVNEKSLSIKELEELTQLAEKLKNKKS